MFLQETKSPNILPGIPIKKFNKSFLIFPNIILYMKKMTAIIIIFFSTLGFFAFLHKKILLNFLDIKGTVIDLEEVEFYHNNRKIKKVKLLHSYL